MATTEEDQLEGQTDEQLTKLHKTLSNYPPSEEVDKSLQLVYAAMQKRGLNGTAAAAPAAAPEPTPAPVAEEPAGPSRAELEDKLTFGIMRKHGIDPSEIATLSDESLAWIVSHPESGAAPAPAAEAPAPPEPQGDVIQTTRVVVPEPEPEPVPVAEDPKPVPALPPERVALEEQVTGPMLKAYKRGRVDVPTLGDNELTLMVEHPKGDVSLEQLETAKALDRGEAPEPLAADPVQDSTPEPVQSEGFGPEAVKELIDSVASAPSDPTPVESGATIEAEESQPPTPATRMTRKAALRTELPANPAQEIIDREGFPVPLELDGDPPRIPHDISKATDDELRSLHARAHAVQTRANYVVGLWEGELRDIVKLRKGREVTVANEIPAKEAGVKITEAQRDAKVQGDPEVVDLSAQEHSVERVLRQLKALQENYAKDVSTCSRQWAMRKSELEGAGGLRS